MSILLITILLTIILIYSLYIGVTNVKEGLVGSDDDFYGDDFYDAVTTAVGNTVDNTVVDTVRLKAWLSSTDNTWIISEDNNNSISPANDVDTGATLDSSDFTRFYTTDEIK